MENLTQVADVAEVIELRDYRAVNDYLAHGYRYLGFFGTSRELARRAPQKGIEGETYINRGVGHMIGRPAGIEHYDPPKREKAVVEPESAAVA